MTQTNGPGCQSVPDPEEFHAMMKRLYKDQRDLRRRDDCLPLENSNVVQARLPRALYSKFYQLLKDQGWSKATGVKYAIYKLTEQQS